MGLSYTGSSCLLIACVTGCSRVPDPPARMIPLYLMSFSIFSFVFQHALATQLVHHLRHALLHAVAIGVQGDLGGLRRFVRRVYTGEVLDLAGTRLAVQSLGIALLADLDGRVQEHLDELARLQELTHQPPISAERRDKGGDHNHPGVHKQTRYLTDATDVLHARLIAEAQILVEPVAHVVAIQ